MKKKIFIAILLCLALSAVAQPGGNHHNTNHGNYNSQSAYCSLSISAASTERFTVSIDGHRYSNASSGHFAIPNLQTGRHTLRVDLKSPVKQSKTITVNLRGNESYIVTWVARHHGGELLVEQATVEVQPVVVAVPQVPSRSGSYQDGYRDGYQDGYRDAMNGRVQQPPVPVVPGMPLDGIAVEETIPVASPDEVARMVAELRQQAFDDTRLSMAKTMVKSKPLLSDDIARLVATFTFEDNKLEFAKYAYIYAADPENYFHLTSSFTYESSKTTLLNYIRQHQR